MYIFITYNTQYTHTYTFTVRRGVVFNRFKNLLRHKFSLLYFSLRNITGKRGWMNDAWWLFKLGNGGGWHKHSDSCLLLIFFNDRQTRHTRRTLYHISLEKDCHAAATEGY